MGHAIVKNVWANVGESGLGEEREVGDNRKKDVQDP